MFHLAPSPSSLQFTRIKEHLDLKRPSQVRDNLCDYNHHTNVNKVEILYFSQKGKRLDSLEAFHTKKQKKNNTKISLQSLKNTPSSIVGGLQLRTQNYQRIYLRKKKRR
jgi:hypothetical protein